MGAHTNVNQSSTAAKKQEAKAGVNLVRVCANNSNAANACQKNEMLSQSSVSFVTSTRPAMKVVDPQTPIATIGTASAQTENAGPQLAQVISLVNSQDEQHGAQLGVALIPAAAESSNPKTDQTSLPARPDSTSAPDSSASSANVHANGQDKLKTTNPFANKFLLGGILLLLLALAVLGGSQALKYFGSFQETDDAYVTGHLHQVSSRVAGTVSQVLVDDNQHVREGQALVLLDQRDFQIKIDQAKADLKQAEQQSTVANTNIEMANVTEQGQNTNALGGIAEARANIAAAEAAVIQAQSSIAQTRADLKAKDAEVDRANADLARYNSLFAQGAVSKQQRDLALRDARVAEANRNAAKDMVAQAVSGVEKSRQAVNTARGQLTKSEGELQLAKASSVQTVVNKNQYNVSLAAIQKAQAALTEAEQNMKYTIIPAPQSGRIGNKSVEIGQRITPGQALLSIVSDHPWVVANFKETQLSKMKVGQEAEVKIDSFPDHKFLGHVESFAPASAASFAILPSDNATGNFTKIVQRVPVKIVLTEESVRGYEDRIVPGMSAVAKVELKDSESVHNTRLAHNR